jgi:hypothetical protein
VGVAAAFEVGWGLSWWHGTLPPSGPLAGFACWGSVPGGGESGKRESEDGKALGTRHLALGEEKCERGGAEGSGGAEKRGEREGGKRRVGGGGGWLVLALLRSAVGWGRDLRQCRGSG